MRGEIWLIEIQGNMRNLRFEAIGVAIDGNHLTSERLQPGRHGTGPRAEVRSAYAGTTVTCEHTLADKIVEPAVCCCVQHQAFAAA